MTNTTSFLFSEQLNKHIDSYLLTSEIDVANYHKKAKDNMPITISGFSEMVRPLLNQLDSINSCLEKKKLALDDCDANLDSLSAIADITRSDSINVFRHKMLAEFDHQVDSLEQLLAGQDSTSMILQGKYMELAGLQYERAKKNADIQTYIVENYGSFLPDTLYDSIKKANESSMSLSSDVFNLELSRMDCSRDIVVLESSFHKNRHDSVGFWDFLYYSFCVSVTVNFGDIAPNNAWSRLFAVLELLGCLLIVGVIVDKVARRLNE